jgi:glycosyltransferase involved in cell wall biosynthesis
MPREGFLRVSVIIPVYNEWQTVAEIIRQVKRVPVEKEIFVVDDGSTDGTRDILASLQGDPEVHIFYHSENRGKGAAIRTALKHVTGEVVIIQDADLEYDPRDYTALLRPIEEGRADVVYGSRFRGGTNRAMFFWHMVGNKLLTLVTNILYDSLLSDMETCYKVFRTEIIKGIPLRSRRFEFEPEITAKVLKRKHCIVEVPISYYGREYHEGKKISWRDAPVAFWTLLKYRFVD